MRRKGLSYLEVLIAAAIALTGILGAIAMFPVAILNMQKGQVVDIAAAAGPSAIDQAVSAGASDPTNWLFLNGGVWTPASVNVGNASYSRREGRLWHNALLPMESFCFDPRFCADVTTWDAAQHVPAAFPYVIQNPAQLVADARMRRVTLARDRNTPVKMPMVTQQARLLFKLQDDLLFVREDDAAGPVPARQDYLQGTTGNQRRNYFADYEWIITATPHTVLSPLSPVGAEQLDQYDVTTVIYHQRPARLDTISTYTAGDTHFVDDERLVEVADMTSATATGAVSEVLLQTRPNRPGSDLLIHEGDVILLSAMAYSRPGVPPGGGAFTPWRPIFRWYRVAQFGEAYPYGSVHQRWVTLDGPDWPVMAGQNLTPIPSQAAADGGAITTRATILTGAVALYRDKMGLQ